MQGDRTADILIVEDEILIAEYIKVLRKLRI